jgi:hypothetical protein
MRTLSVIGYQKIINPTMMIVGAIPLSIGFKRHLWLLTNFNSYMKKRIKGRDMFTDVKLMHDSGLNAESSIGYKVNAKDKKNVNISLLSIS